MRVRTIPLWNGLWTTGLTSPLLSPEMPRGMHDAVVAIAVEQVQGAPTTATITPTIQLWHPTVGGNWVENGGGSGAGLYPRFSWQTLSAAENPSLLPDGDFPATLNVSAATTSTPVYITRRVDGGFPWRLSLAWTLTGGTSPKIGLSVNVFIRESPAAGFDRVESGA